METAASRIDLLARVPVFAGLERGELERLCQCLEEVNLDRGGVLFKEGEPGDTFYLIERGELEVRAAAQPERMLRRLGPGDVLGEIALLLGGVRTATVTAGRPSTLLALSKEGFHALFGSHPSVLESISRLLAQRMAASSAGEGSERPYTSVAVFGARGVKGKTVVATTLAALLAELSGAQVLIVDLRQGEDRGGPTPLVDLAEGQREALDDALHREGAGCYRLVAGLDGLDGDQLAGAADALAWKGHDRFPIVVFDLPDADVARAGAVGKFADVAVEVTRKPDASSLPDPVRHYVVVNRWHDDAPALDIAHCEPFVLPADLALCGSDPAERARIVLTCPRTPASPPLRRLARKILGVSVGVALGGGAAFGIAHVGVLRAFERHGLEVDLLAGTSMGSIVALGFAAGITPGAMVEIARRIGNKRTTLSALDFNLFQPGLLAGDRLVAIFEPFLGSVKRFDQLTYPCQTVAADIESGESVLLSTGLLTAAFRASCSVPMLWQPVRRDGRTLVDGGLVDPVPSSVTRSMGADFCIGVNAVPRLKKGVETALSRWYRKGAALNPMSRWGPRNDLPSTFDTVMNTIQLMQHELGKFKAISADVRIDPDLSDFTWIEFYRPAELIERGEEAAEQTIPRIQELLARRLAGRSAA